jgi:hypothetical protein
MDRLPATSSFHVQSFNIHPIPACNAFPLKKIPQLSPRRSRTIPHHHQINPNAYFRAEIKASFMAGLEDDFVPPSKDLVREIAKPFNNWFSPKLYGFEKSANGRPSM